MYHLHDHAKEDSLPPWGRKRPRAPRARPAKANAVAGYGRAAMSGSSGSGRESGDEGLEPEAEIQKTPLYLLACCAAAEQVDAPAGMGSQNRTPMPPNKRQKTGRARSGDLQSRGLSNNIYTSEDLPEPPLPEKPLRWEPSNRSSRQEDRAFQTTNGLYSPKGTKRRPGSPVARRFHQGEGSLASKSGIRSIDRDLPSRSAWGVVGQRTAASRDRGAGNENSAFATGSSGFRNGVRGEWQDRQSNYTYDCKKGQRHLFIAHFIQKVQRGAGPAAGVPPPRFPPSVQATRPEKQVPTPKVSGPPLARERSKAASQGSGLPSPTDLTGSGPTQSSSHRDGQASTASAPTQAPSVPSSRKPGVKVEPTAPTSSLPVSQSMGMRQNHMTPQAGSYFPPAMAPMRQQGVQGMPAAAVTAIMAAQMQGAQHPGGTRGTPQLSGFQMNPGYNAHLNNLLLSNLAAASQQQAAASLYAGMNPTFGGPGALLQNGSMGNPNLAAQMAAALQTGGNPYWGGGGGPLPASLLNTGRASRDGPWHLPQKAEELGKAGIPGYLDIRARQFPMPPPGSYFESPLAPNGMERLGMGLDPARDHMMHR